MTDRDPTQPDDAGDAARENRATEAARSVVLPLGLSAHGQPREEWVDAPEGAARADASRSDEASGAASRGGRILRFGAPEIRLHWSIALPFLFCFITGMTLVFIYNPAPMRPGREVLSWTHRVFGVLLCVGPILMVLLHRKRFNIHWENVAEAWSISREDLKWLALTARAVFDKSVELPPADKFNAGEKLNFITVMWAAPLLVLTGITIWLPGVNLFIWALHFYLAFMFVPLVCGHIFMAVANPDTRIGLSGMITGLVDQEWAKHHYRNWYERRYGGDSADQAAPTSDAEPREQKETGRADEAA